MHILCNKDIKVELLPLPFKHPIPLTRVNQAVPQELANWQQKQLLFSLCLKGNHQSSAVLNVVYKW